MARTVTRPGIIGISLLLVALAFFTHQFRLEAPDATPEVVKITQDNVGETISFTATGTTNAFSLTNERATIEYEEYSFGNFITSINGVTAPSGSFWQLSLNGSGAAVGASDLQLEVGDIITWQLVYE